MRASRATAVYVAIAASLLGTVAVARAEPSAADRETARSLMREGRELRDQGDLTGALARFRAADDIMHVPTTGLEVARTDEALGLLIEARDAIAAVRNLPAKPGDPEPFLEARRKADELDTLLEGRIPSLKIVVDAPDGEAPAVQIDGIAVPPATLGIARRIDPGHHVIVARTLHAEATRETDVRESEQGEVRLSLQPPLATPDVPSAIPPAEDGRQPPRSHAPGAWTYAGIGVAAAGLVVGVATGLASWSDKSSLSGECPKFVCPPGAPSQTLDSAHLLASISTVSFVLAGVGAGVTVASLAIGIPRSGLPRSAKAAATLRIEPWVGAGFTGVRGAF